MGSTTPRFVRPEFYKWPTPKTPQNLIDEFDFLANTVQYAEKDVILPSESLVFNMVGKELPRPHPIIKERLPRSISEYKLLEKIASAPRRTPGEQWNAETKDEAPPFASIPDQRPDDPREGITKEDIKMEHGLTGEQ